MNILWLSPEMRDVILLSSAVGVPLLLSLGLLIPVGKKAFLRLVPWSVLPALAVLVFVRVDTVIELNWFFLTVSLGMDASARIFLLFTAFIWLVVSIFAGSYPMTANKARFFGFYLLTMTGNFGLILAQDILGFYLFFALMSFSSYVLIIFTTERKALQAGKVYISMVLLGEVLIFTAVVMIATASESLNIQSVPAAILNSPWKNCIILFVLVGFGIKAGVFPLHVWLPLAHTVAPLPASAVLSSVIIKAGLMGWLRFLPLGVLLSNGWGILLIGVGLITAFYGALTGVTQKHPKTVLAYSSISQMGLATVGTGMIFLAPKAMNLILPAILLFSLHHGLTKGTLFLSVGILQRQIESRWGSAFVVVTLLFLSSSLAGAPFTSGAVAKHLLKSNLVLFPLPWGTMIKLLLQLSSVCTTLIVLRFLFLTLPRAFTGKHRLGPGMFLPWILMAIAAIVAVWLLPWLDNRYVWSVGTIFSEFWPVFFGVAIVAIARTNIVRQHYSVFPQLPPGDILIPVNRFLQRMITLASQVGTEKLPAWKNRLLQASNKMWAQFNTEKYLLLIEESFTKWKTAGTIFIFLGILFAILISIN